MRCGWSAAGAAILALLPFAGGLSTGRVFFVRDLGAYFWPRHLWLRQMWQAGEWPWWDPFAGAGQSAVADALNQFFLLPVTIVRLLLPDVPGFNFWVAAPFPLLAAGMWLWLRRWVSPFAAFVGAATLAVSGPVLSSGNFPNFSWAVALIPWVLRAVDRLMERCDAARIATLAGIIALQALAGEPVTLIATAVVAVSYALAVMPAVTSAERFRRAAHVSVAGAVAVLLAAVQLIPLAMAAARSPRDGSIDAMFWSLHPLALVETVLGHVFGHAFDAPIDDLAWLAPLNSGREPLLYSLYMGIGVVALAALGGAAPRLRPWRRFWWAAGAMALIAAFGEHTIVYRILHDTIPIVSAFRFPVKFVVFTAFALSALAAAGADQLLDHARGRWRLPTPRLAAVLVVAMTAFALAMAVSLTTRAPWALDAIAALARSVGMDSAGMGDGSRAPVDWLVASAPPLLWRVAVLAGGVLLLAVLVWSRHRWALAAACILCVAAIADPLVVNANLHPTMAASKLGPPAWAEAAGAHGSDRVYIGGHLTVDTGRRGRQRLVDAPSTFDASLDESRLEAASAVTAQFAYVPSPWGLREVISYDLPQLWPREYHLMLNRFRAAAPEARLRFLDRVGTRVCFLPEPPVPGLQPVVPPAAPSGPMAVYECHAGMPRRVHLADAAIVDADTGRQLDRLFAAGSEPWSTVALDRQPPAASGRPGAAHAAEARILSETGTRVVIAAAVAGDDGYLAMADSYDPWWQVTVDGRSAPLLRANGMFRAVRLTPGEHLVEMRYRPTPMYAGAALSGVTLLVLVGWMVLQRASGPAAGRGRRRSAPTSAKATAGKRTPGTVGKVA